MDDNKAANDVSFKPILDHQKTQAQQLNVLKNIEHSSSETKSLTIAQLAEQKSSVNNDTIFLEQTKKVNTNLLKVGQSIKAAVPAGKYNAEDDGYGKSAFSFRNLFDIKRGSGGVIDEHLSRKEDAKAAKMQAALDKPLPYERGALGVLNQSEGSAASIGGVTASERQEEGDELNKEAVKETKEHTRLLTEILAALTGMKALASKPAETNAAVEGGFGLGDLIPNSGRGNSKPAGKPSMGARAMRALRSPMAIGGAVLGVAGGAYEAYSGWQDANAEEATANKDIEAKVASGEITEKEAVQLKAETSDKTDVKKGEAVGGGAGGALGALGGAAVGAAIGSAVPIVGTVIGGVVGGALGYAAGTELGKKAGGALVSGYKGVKSFFGFGKEEKKEPKMGQAVTTEGGVSLFPDETQEDFVKRRVPVLLEKYPDNMKEDVGIINSSRQQAELEYKTLKKKQGEIRTQKGQVAAENPASDSAFNPSAGMKVTSDVTVKTNGGTKRIQTSEGATIANEMVVPGQPLSDKQMAMVKYSTGKGNNYPKEIMDQYESQKGEFEAKSKMQKEEADAKRTPEQKRERYLNLQKLGLDEPEDNPEYVKPVVSKPTSSKGDLVYQQSTAAEDAKEDVVSSSNKASAPSVVSAPTTINSNKTQVSNGKPDIRNSDSSFNKYMDTRYA